MSNLALAAWILGGAMVVIHAPCLFFPQRARAWMAGFPRNRWAGVALTAVDIVWSAWLVMHIPLGRFDYFKPSLYVVAPVLFALIVWLMDELLAARALGGLLLLIPSPLLDVARWHESDLRLVVTILAYIFVVKGIALVLCPYLFRKAVAWWARNDTWCRVGGGLGLALGLFLIVLAVTVY
jgi:uncharacterized protein YjeT (DUF2065 family)